MVETRSGPKGRCGAKQDDRGAAGCRICGHSCGGKPENSPCAVELSGPCLQQGLGRRSMSRKEPAPDLIRVGTGFPAGSCYGEDPERDDCPLQVIAPRALSPWGI